MFHVKQSRLSDKETNADDGRWRVLSVSRETNRYDNVEWREQVEYRKRGRGTMIHVKQSRLSDKEANAKMTIGGEYQMFHVKEIAMTT